MDLSDLTLEEVKEIANNIEGFTFHPATGEDKLKDKLAKYIADNPRCLDMDGIDNENKTLPVTPPADDTEKTSEGVGENLTEIKGVVGGEVTSLNEPPSDEDKPNEDAEIIPENVKFIKTGESTWDEAPLSGMIKIKSDYRGVISSSFGDVDFGNDGIAEVSKECAEMLIKLKGYEKC